MALPSWAQDIVDRLKIIFIPSVNWRPSYEPQQYISQDVNGVEVRWPLAITYFVTAETAEHLRAIYDPQGIVVEIPYLGAGGPTEQDPSARWLKWPNGVLMEGGLLAAFFDEFPNDPKSADAAVRQAIQSAGAA